MTVETEAGTAAGRAVPPLVGVTVVDFTTLLPGPLAGLILAEAGAEVIKVERPVVGDDMRHFAPPGALFDLLNRGKRSIALDLKSPDAIERLMPLLARADIVIEQFRPGVMDRLGLGYARLAAINPGLVYCAITGYGQDGPKAQQAAHDLDYMAETGVLALAAGTDGRPIVPPVLAADIAGGAYPAVMNILLALRRREASGAGAFIDIAMADNLFPFAFWAQALAQSGGREPRPGGELLSGGSPRYRIYPTADGRFVAAAPLEQKFWENFCRLIDLPDVLRDDRRDPAATIAGVAALIAGRTSVEWERRFAGADVCCAVVRSFAEARADPHFRGRGLFDRTVRGADGRARSALPVPVAPGLRVPDQERAAPALGQDDALLG